MEAMLKSGRLLSRSARVAILFAIVSAMGAAVWPQSTEIEITLVGQSMIRSDIRATAPAAVPVIQGLLKGDGVHQLGIRGRRKRRDGPGGQGISYSA